MVNDGGGDRESLSYIQPPQSVFCSETVMWFTAPEGTFRMSSFRAKRWKKKYSPGSSEKEKDGKDSSQSPEPATVPSNNWEFVAFTPSLFGKSRGDSGESTPSPPASRPGSRPPSWLAALPHHFVIEELDEELSKVAHTAEKSGGGGGGETKGGGGRERRPDPVREASEETQSRTKPSSQDHEPPDPGQHHHDFLPHNVTKTKGPGVSRSESYKEPKPQKRQHRDRRKTSDPNLSKTNNDVEIDAQPFTFQSNSGSSSNSSLSARLDVLPRSLESPSTSTEAVAGLSQQQWDSDIESDPVEPEWTTLIPPEVLESMSEDEIKRQETINELFYTEKSQVRALKVLQRVFYRPLKEKDLIPHDQLQLIFSNIEEMVQFHSTFNNSMKALRNENPVIGDVGHLFLKMFDGPDGENFQRAAATFCAHQHYSLEVLKERRKKDQRFNNFLNEAEKTPVCRRLQLKDILPTGWQRLTKYHLLLENLVKHSKGRDPEEINNLVRALERSKEILHFINSAIKDSAERVRLSDIQKRLDTGPFDRVPHPIVSEFKNLDVTKHHLIYEGALNLRIQNRQRLIDLHVVLLEDFIILLQKQDEKYVLKFYSQYLSPIVKMSTALVRHNAVDKNSLYLVNTSQNEARIYDLVANTPADKEVWFKHIYDTAEAYKTKEGKRRGDQSSTEEPTTLEDGGDGELLQPQQGSPVPSSSPQADSSTSPQPQQNNSPRLDGERVRNDEMLATYTEEGALVEPSEVVVSQRDIHTAQPVLTPLEKLRRKDELVRQALFEKQVLVADILHVPHEEFEAIADLAGEQTGDKDPTELILAAINQASTLSRLVNETLRVSEEEIVTSTRAPGQVPSISAPKLYSIATSLNSQLSQLLNVMNERDEERERLRKELQRLREQLHSMHERQDQNGFLHEDKPRTESTTLPSPSPSEMLDETLSVEVRDDTTPEEHEATGVAD